MHKPFTDDSMITIDLSKCLAASPRDWSLAEIQVPSTVTIDGATLAGRKAYHLPDLPPDLAAIVAEAIGGFVSVGAGWLVRQAAIERADIVALPETDFGTPSQTPEPPSVTVNYRLTLALTDADTQTLHGNLTMQTDGNATLHKACELLEGYGEQFNA